MFARRGSVDRTMRVPQWGRSCARPAALPFLAPTPIGRRMRQPEVSGRAWAHSQRRAKGWRARAMTATASGRSLSAASGRVQTWWQL